MSNYLAVQHAQLVGAAMQHASHATHRVIEAARDHRWAPPPMTAVYVDDVYPDTSMDDEFEAVLLGAADASGVPPVAMRLYAESGGVDDDCRIVRSDTPSSYPDFCSSLSAEFATFRQRLDALEKAFAQHVGDPTAHGKIQRAADAVLGAQAVANMREMRDAIPMQFPPESVDKIRPWRSGDHICVTLCFPSLDGDVRFLTCTTPASTEAAKLARYVDASGVSPVEVLGCVDPMCNVLGAGSLVPIICAGAPDVLALDALTRQSGNAGPFVARLQPSTLPSARAVLMLAYCCDDGDEQAMREWDRIADTAERHSPRIASVMNDAAEAVQS